MKTYKILLSIILYCLSLFAYDYLAVAPFTGQGISKEESSTLTNIFIKKYNAAAKHKIMARSQSDQILKELEFKWDPAFSILSNALAIARLLSVPYIIIGHIEVQNKTSKCNFQVFDFKTNKCIKTFTKSLQGTPNKLLSVIIPQIIKPMDEIIAKEGTIMASPKKKEPPADKETEIDASVQKADIEKDESPEEKPDVIDKKAIKKSKTIKEGTALSKAERKNKKSEENKKKMEEKRKRKEAAIMAKTEAKRQKALEKHEREKEKAKESDKSKKPEKVTVAPVKAKKPEKDITTKKEEPKKDKFITEKKTEVPEKKAELTEKQIATTPEEKKSKKTVSAIKNPQKEAAALARAERKKQKAERNKIKAGEKKKKMEDKSKRRQAEVIAKTEKKRQEALERHRLEREKILGPETKKLGTETKD